MNAPYTKQVLTYILIFFSITFTSASMESGYYFLIPFLEGVGADVGTLGGLVMGACYGVSLVLRPLVPFFERFAGKEAVIRTGFFAFFVSACGIALFARTPEGVIICRAIAGIGMGVVTIILQSYEYQLLPAEVRGRCVSLITVAYSLPALIVVPPMEYLIRNGYYNLYAMTFPFIAALGLYTVMKLPKTKSSKAPAKDGKPKEKVSYLWLVRSPQVLFFAASAALFAFSDAAQLRFVQLAGERGLAASYFFSVSACTAMIFRLSCGKLVDKLPRKVCAPATTLLTARQEAETALNDGMQPLQQTLNDTAAALRDQLTKAQEMLAQLNEQRDKLQKMLASLGDEAVDPAMADMAVQLLLSGTEAQLQLGEFRVSSGKTQLEAGKTQLEAAQEEYESAREEALKSANLNQLLNMTTLQQLIYAQNFSMPAGYIEGGDGDDNRYIVKVGDAFADADELKSMVLCNIDGIGDVRLSDVAEVEMTDNADDAYAKVDKNRAVLLSLYKSSTSSTSTVSNASSAAMETMMAENEGLHLTPIMDQGDYIKLIVNSVLSNLIEGAALAIIVLALFLKDLRPTIVVAISMPLSVLFAIVLMYFTGITFNILSLSGLALGVGMLVDNSVVVIENIYRLRGRGVPAARASVQGARQVAGSIVSSTLTTICVFLPLVFTTGMVRELLSDMAWTITFSLLASLVVALTVVPCAGSTVLKKQKDIKHPLFDKVLNGYEKLLRFCLRRKAVPLALAIALLGVSVWRVATMGIVMIPDMSSNQLTITVNVPDDTAKEDAFATADSVMDAVMTVDGVDTVGAMSGGSNNMVAMAGSNAAADNTTFTYYVLLGDKAPKAKVVEQEIYGKTADLNCEIEVNSNGMMDMSALSGSGIEVDLYGSDLNDLAAAGKQVMALMEGIDGIQNVTDGQDAGDAEINITIDKDKAMRMGLTVAQVYQQIAAKLTTDTTATTLKAGGDSYSVVIVDKTDTPTLDDIFNMEFETTTTDENGSSVKETHTLGEFATRTTTAGYTTIARENGSRKLAVTSETADGYNTTLLSRELEPQLAALDLPDGVTAELAGETTQVTEMLSQMAKMLALALAFVYFVMVAQFQSLLSPFIVLFTIPLAFTGGMLGLMAAGEQLSLISLMGFLVLMGVVVNNGIVFVDYANQLRIGGLERTDALVATGRTRMRPILMTTLTTVLAMVTMLFGTDMASEMSTGMAIVIIGGLSYATLMTLFVVPVLYDLFYRRPPVNIDVGDDGLDDLPDDAAEFAAEFAARRAAEAASAPRRPDLSRAARAPEENDGEKKEADHDNG